MKTTLFITASTVIVALFTACSKPDPIKERNDALKQNFTKYIIAQMSAEERANSEIDSIVILQIDTLTEKDCIDFTMKNMSDEFDAVEQKAHDDAVSYENAKYLKFDGYMLEDFKRKADDSEAKKQDMIFRYAKLRDQLPKADDKKFKYYSVKMDIHIIEKGASRKLTVALPADVGLKPVSLDEFK